MELTEGPIVNFLQSAWTHIKQKMQRLTQNYGQSAGVNDIFKFSF